MSGLILYIDTSKTDEISVKFKNREWKSDSRISRAEGLLPLIDKALKESGLTVKDLTGIEINPGPGSYTGLRVGAAVANVMAWVLGLNEGKQVEPVYD